MLKLAQTPDHHWQQAARASAPAALGYVPLGFVFGVVFNAAGIGPWYWSVLMSVLVYAGGAQFAAVGLISRGAGTTEMVISTLLLNLRHLFYGLPFVGRLPQGWIQPVYFIFGMTDETYALMTADTRLQHPALALPLVVWTHLWWVLGTVLGAAGGHWLSLDFRGLEFCLLALFAVMTTQHLRAKKNYAGVVVAAGWTILAMSISERLGLITGMILTTLTLCMSTLTSKPQ